MIYIHLYVLLLITNLWQTILASGSTWPRTQQNASDVTSAFSHYVACSERNTNLLKESMFQSQPIPLNVAVPITFLNLLLIDLWTGHTQARPHL